MSSRYTIPEEGADYSRRYSSHHHEGAGGSHERGPSNTPSYGGGSSAAATDDGVGDSFTRFLAQKSARPSTSGEAARPTTSNNKWLSTTTPAGSSSHHQHNQQQSLGSTSIVIDLRARVAELEYELAVAVDKLSDMTRSRDQYQHQLEHLTAASSARHEVQRALEGSGGGSGAQSSIGGASATLKHISRASDRFSAATGGGPSAAGKSTADAAEELYILQRDFAKLSEESRKKDVEIAKLTGSVKRLQDGMSNEVNKGVFEVEKELVSLRRELAAEQEKSTRLRQDGVMLDAVLRENFNLEDMSQTVSHSILIPSDALFHRLRTDHRRNNFLSSKYDVSVEFTAAAGRSIVLRGKRLNVELLKGEIYAVLNEMHSTKIAGGGALDISAARSQQHQNGVSSSVGMNASSAAGVGGAASMMMSRNNTATGGGGDGSMISGMSLTAPTTRGRRNGQNEEVDHLCSTIATHEATIEALHTAMRHAQDRAAAAEREAKACRDARDEFEEQAKNAEILKKARESELGHRVVLLEKQLAHAQEANNRAVSNSKEESAITQQYRDENEKLRDEIAELIESREVAERSCYVANEHSKLLSIKEQESTRAAAHALSDRAHVERLTHQLEEARKGRDEMVERLAREAGELKLELRKAMEQVEVHRKNTIDGGIALEAAQHEVGIHKELVEELRHRLIKMIHSQSGGGGVGGSSASHIFKGPPTIQETDTTELIHRSGKMLHQSQDGGNNRHHPDDHNNNHHHKSTLASTFFNGEDDINNHNNNVSSSSGAGGLVATPRNTRGSGGGGRMLSTEVSSDAVLVDKLFMENDNLKKELQRSHDEVREVAHSLKETRHIRELTAKELEKLQKQRSQWTDEKTAIQRTRMEEQLVSRQVQAEADMKVASLEDNLAQSKKRAEVLHEQLLKEQRGAHEAILRAESAEAAMASMHKELQHSRNTNQPPPSGATSTTGSVSGKPRGDARRPTSPHHNSSLKRPPVTSSSSTTNAPPSTISRARVVPPPPTTTTTSTTTKRTLSTTSSAAAAAAPVVSHADRGGGGGGASHHSDASMSVPSSSHKATPSNMQAVVGGGASSSVDNSPHRSNTPTSAPHDQHRGYESDDDVGGGGDGAYNFNMGATLSGDDRDIVGGMGGGPFGGQSSASIYSPEGRTMDELRAEELELQRAVEESSRADNYHTARGADVGGSGGGYLVTGSIHKTASELSAARASSRDDVEKSLQDILAKYKGVGGGTPVESSTHNQRLHGATTSSSRSTLSEIADNRDVFRVASNISQHQHQDVRSGGDDRGKGVVVHGSEEESSGGPSPIPNPKVPRKTQQFFNYNSSVPTSDNSSYNYRGL